MEMGEKAQTIILAPTDKIKALDIVGEVKKRFKKTKSRLPFSYNTGND